MGEKGERRPYDDTGIGGPAARFPETPLSAVLGAGSTDAVVRARAFEILVQAYWKPVYKAVRRKWRKSNEEAKDLTQAFFTRALEKAMFDSYDATRGRFRTFLRACMDNFVTNERIADQRLKRGGQLIKLSLDFEGAEAELAGAAAGLSPDEQFDQDFAKSLFDMGLDALREELAAAGKEGNYEIFQRYELGDRNEKRPTYAELAEQLGIKVTDVTNRLAASRRLFRRLVLQKLREITASEEEFESEAQLVLGIDVAELEP
jgi:RNA polymerase sigma factor (sigma-70 family)